MDNKKKNTGCEVMYTANLKIQSETTQTINVIFIAFMRFDFSNTRFYL